MGKDTLDENEKELLLQEMKERLDFYTFQAPEGQFDAKKVEVLVKCIQELEPNGNGPKQEGAKKGITALEASGQDTLALEAAKQKMLTSEADFESFQKYRAEKAADAKRLAALGSIGGRGGSRKHPSADARWTGRRRFAKAAAIGIAVLFAVGGSIGAANAQMDGGLVRWLKKGGHGEVIVVEPQKENMPNQGLDDFDEDITEAYNSAEELPEPYRGYFVDLEGLEGLEGYGQGQILLFGNKSSWELDTYWECSGKAPLCFAVWDIGDSVIVQDKEFDDFENFYDKEVNGIELHVCGKPDGTGENDVAVYFYYGNRRYTVESRLSTEEMEQLAIGYLDRILGKNKNF